MAPIRHVGGVFSFAITGGLTDQAEPLGLVRALRRAVMARVQKEMRSGETLPVFFSGHAADGAPARENGHRHLAFAFDPPRNRLMIVAPHILERREASKSEREHLRVLEGALEGFHELRAGPAGRLALVPCRIEMQGDPLFARSCKWESLTSYCVTRHVKLSHAAAAFEADLLAECLRSGLPRPRVLVSKTFGRRGSGLFGLAELEFHAAVEGPVLLGRDRHFGGGLFAAVEQEAQG
jgi:CRISPR-associated protein Csb2